MTAFLSFLDAGGRTVDLVIVVAGFAGGAAVLLAGILAERRKDGRLGPFAAVRAHLAYARRQNRHGGDLDFTGHPRLGMTTANRKGRRR